MQKQEEKMRNEMQDSRRWNFGDNRANEDNGDSGTNQGKYSLS